MARKRIKKTKKLLSKEKAGAVTLTTRSFGFVALTFYLIAFIAWFGFRNFVILMIFGCLVQFIFLVSFVLYLKYGRVNIYDLIIHKIQWLLIFPLLTLALTMSVFTGGFMQKSLLVGIIMFLMLSFLSLCFYLILFKDGNNLTETEQNALDNEQAEWILNLRTKK